MAKVSRAQRRAASSIEGAVNLRHAPQLHPRWPRTGPEGRAHQRIDEPHPWKEHRSGNGTAIGAPIGGDHRVQTALQESTGPAGHRFREQEDRDLRARLFLARLSVLPSGATEEQQQLLSEKLDRNIARDKQKLRELKKAGWHAITIRECRLREAPAIQLRRIEKLLRSDR